MFPNLCAVVVMILLFVCLCTSVVLIHKGPVEVSIFKER